MNPLIKRLALALLVVSVAVASATPVAAAERGHFTKTPLAGPWYTPQELKALTAYSNASFAQKKALLAGGNAARHDALGADARQIVERRAFDWGDAGVGAAGAFGLTLLASGLLIVSRHGRRRVP